MEQRRGATLLVANFERRWSNGYMLRVCANAVALTLALVFFFVCCAFAQTSSGCGIVSYSSPSTPGYEQGGGPSGFNVGDLPDADFSDRPQEVVTVPQGDATVPRTSNAIAYGSCIVTESIDEGICYDVDDSGRLSPGYNCVE
jgi:hypothetical protein